MTVFIGIDPGISGAIAFVSTGPIGGLMGVHDMPVMKLGKSSRVNASALTKLLSSYVHVQCHAVIERVSAMPKQGVVSVFTFGHSAGILEGVVPALGIPYELVTPHVWKKHFNLIGAGKEASRAKAIQLYPGAPLERKKDVGRAEAILLARYAIDNLVGGAS